MNVSRKKKEYIVIGIKKTKNHQHSYHYVAMHVIRQVMTSMLYASLSNNRQDALTSLFRLISVVCYFKGKASEACTNTSEVQ